MDKFSQMQAFHAVAETGGFAAAAKKLEISKGAASRRVAELEERLGARLFQRTTRRVSMTEEGRALFARAAELIAALDEAETEVASKGSRASGTLRLSAPTGFGSRVLAPLWTEFLAAHPAVSLEIELSDRLVDLVSEGFDMAVRIGELRDSSLVARQVGSTRLMLLGAPGFAERLGPQADPSVLDGAPAAVYSLWSGGSAWELDGPGGERATAKVRPIVKSNSGEACLEMAKSGSCAALQPCYLAAPMLSSGQLVELLPGWRSKTMGIHAVAPSRKHMPPKVRAMFDFLSSKLSSPNG